MLKLRCQTENLGQQAYLQDILSGALVFQYTVLGLYVCK
jgi:hypothetical protein